MHPYIHKYVRLPSVTRSCYYILMQEWVAPAGKPYWSGAYLWALDKTQHGLHYHIYPQWQRLLNIVPEQKRLVAKRTFAATFDYNRQGGETWDEIYAHPFLVKDIIHYRAAAIACHYAIQLTDWSPRYLTAEVEPGMENLHPYDHENLDGKEDSLRKYIAIELLSSDWKVLFADDGKAHKSLCRTLMNLPGGINGSLLCHLPNAAMWLNRPITDRVELLTFLLFARTAFDAIHIAKWVGPIYAKVQRAEVIAALRILSKHLRRELRTRRKDIIALPDDSAITFLSHAEDIFNEGMLMHHCIASHAGSAVQGQCYLFHVEYQNTLASVMVDLHGRVVQSYGPHNTITPASEYGRHVLSEWGKAFPVLEMPTVAISRNIFPYYDLDDHPF